MHASHARHSTPDAARWKDRSAVLVEIGLIVVGQVKKAVGVEQRVIVFGGTTRIAVGLGQRERLEPAQRRRDLRLGFHL